MGLRINNNIYSLNARRHLSNISSRLAGNYARLASGLRIATAADDAAGLGISERMRAQIRSLNQAGRNAQDGISVVQTAEGSLGEVNGNLSRMRELAIQSASGTLNTGDRAVLSAEFAALIAEIDRVATQTKFNGIALFAQTQQLDIQVGIQAGETIALNLEDMTKAGLSLDGGLFDLTSISNASAALSTIDAAIGKVSAFRGRLGAAQNRLASIARSIASSAENLAAAESRIRDVDVARETADLARNSILQQAALSVLVQANTQPSLALSLLG